MIISTEPTTLHTILVQNQINQVRMNQLSPTEITGVSLLPYHLTYYQLILNQIDLYQSEIIINLDIVQKIQETKDELINEYSPSEDKIVFSRLDTNMSSNCNFCKKIAYYEDNNNKLYCWFHRTQYED